MPQARGLLTKAHLGRQLLERARVAGGKLEAVGCDGCSGRDGAFRAELSRRNVQYMADVPAKQRVDLSEPKIGLPTHKKGRKAKHERGVAPTAVRVDRLRKEHGTHWQALTIRATHRGQLTADFAARPVWSVWQDAAQALPGRQDMLVLRRHSAGTGDYSLSNADPSPSLQVLAHRTGPRLFIARANQDAKSEFGWAAIQTTQSLAWPHHLALTILAAGFIAQPQLAWPLDYQRADALLERDELEGLPALSVANGRA